mmetsp:Transcript_9431/g.23496  ORF Transcript_9431/g.23496 Transcript_9431/m.23496 type:complete len:692 (+) Transcript_9431:129-2204(+)
MTRLEFERNKMIATVIFVAALFTSSAATGPSASFDGYRGYGQYQQVQQQQQQYQPNQQQDRWYTEASQASNTAQPSTSTPDAAPAEDTEKPPLPEGWSEHFDPNSGQHYYYNSVDGTTSWDRPQPPNSEGQGVNQGESNGEDSAPLEQNLAGPGASDVTQSPSPEQERPESPEESTVGGVNGNTETVAVPESSSTEPSGSEQQSDWGGQGQSQYSQDSWISAHPSQQHPGGQSWGQSNSTESSVVRGEPEVKKAEYGGQSPQNPSQPQGSPGWGLPQQTKTDDSSPKPVEPWGVRKSPEPQNQYQTGPPKQMQPSSPTTETSPTSNAGSSPQYSETPSNQRQSWQDRPPMGNQQPPPMQQGPPQQGPPHASRPPPQQQPQQYLQRQYPPYGSYNPNAPPGQGQYDPRYGGQNQYGRGYPPQQPGTGQLVSQVAEDGTSAVKEALSSTWQGLLGFGNKTREVVGTARDQVVTGATAAGQTITARSTSIWETAKSTVGGVFENNDSGAQPGYNLSGHPGASQNQQNYQGRPGGPSQGYPGPGGRGPPPRGFGGPQQQPGPGRYGPPPGQQPRYGSAPSGSIEPPRRQQPPASHQQPPQQMRQPGYPNMQPRRDPPYPQRPNGPERGPMQSQYGSQSNSQQPPQGAYPPQQRPPYPGAPGAPGAQPRGPGMTQATPQQEKASDPWDHPALTGDY